MTVPKRRVSKSAKKMRRSHLHLKAVAVGLCPNCGNSKLPHRICVHCGYYKGKEIVSVDQEKS